MELSSNRDVADIMRPILNSIEEGIHAVNKEGVTIFYNEVAGRLDSLSPDEVIGKHLLDIFPSLTVESSTLLNVLHTGKPIHNKPQTYTTYRGRKIHTINTTLPIISQGELIGAVEVSKDVTQVIELTEQLIDLRTRLLKHRDRDTHSPLQARYSFDDIQTVSGSLEQLKKKAMRAAKSSSPVLLYGETGTGKELFAHAIHNASPRADRPFIAQNCAALPASLLEGLLFGTVKGSFTGAENRPGLFELAHGGTLFLDEIHSMSAELQAKLLRVIQDGEVRRVGDTKVTPVDVRLIAAVNETPETLLQENKLRPDLYYRLNVVYLAIPALRERPEDIDLLTGTFVEAANRTFQLSVRGVAPEVRERFHAYLWPGNVRELENTIQGAMHMVEGEWIEVEHLPERIQKAARLPESPVRDRAAVVQELVPLRQALRELERELITRALRQTSGNVQLAARLLKIPRQTLQYRLSKIETKSSRCTEATVDGSTG
jgi:arginine utilization regulatory protein